MLLVEFHAIRLLVNDFARSLTFYRDTLGFAGWHNDAMEYAYFEEKQLALFARSRMVDILDEADKQSAGYTQSLLQFETNDLDALYTTLTAKGVNFLKPPTEMPAWGSRIALFRDPDGNLIELYMPLAR
jgi:catechol 2,3-dioxygenase-like lactoylglutathione lyase family enzyme